MAARGMITTADMTITYDGVPVRIKRGTVIDVPNGSALATALGANVTPLTAQQQVATGGALDSVGGPPMFHNNQVAYGAASAPFASDIPAETGGMGDEHALTGNN